MKMQQFRIPLFKMCPTIINFFYSRNGGKVMFCNVEYCGPGSHIIPAFLFGKNGELTTGSDSSTGAVKMALC